MSILKFAPSATVLGLVLPVMTGAFFNSEARASILINGNFATSGTAMQLTNPTAVTGWTAGGKALAFTAIGTPSGQQPWDLLNNVTATNLGAVPEPASLAVLGIPAAMALLRRRKQI